MAPTLNVPPRSQDDLTVRLDPAYIPFTAYQLRVGPGDFYVNSEPGYVGTDIQYQHHSSSTEAPLGAASGPENTLETYYHNEVVAVYT